MLSVEPSSQETGHTIHRLQIVSRLHLTKYTYKQEHNLVYEDKPKNVHTGKHQYHELKSYFICTKTRNIKIKHHILDFIPPKKKQHFVTLCKKPLHAYFIRDLMHWCAQSPRVWMKHDVLTQSEPNFILSYDICKVYANVDRQSIKGVTWLKY